MTSTLTRNARNGETLGIEPARRRQRSLPLAMVAAACMAASIAAFVGLQLAATDLEPVLAVTRPVQAGSTITDADLTVAHVAEDPHLSTVPLSQRSTVIGRTAAIDLAPGTLLVDGALGEASVLADGESLVGVEVPAAAAPIDALSPGTRVSLVAVARPGESADRSTTAVIAEGRVLRAASSDPGSAPMVRVSVVVPAETGPDVAAASAGQHLAVVVTR